MTYFERLKEATNQHEAAMVVEDYTEEFRNIMEAAGLEPVVGRIPAANDSTVWVSFSNLSGREVLDIMAAVTMADDDLGKRLVELRQDILDCSNHATASDQAPAPAPAPAEEEPAAPEVDPDADTSSWLCPEDMHQDELEANAAKITPLDMLHKGKIETIVSPIVVNAEDDDFRTERDMVVTQVHGDGDGVIVAISGYSVMALKDFRNTVLTIEPATIEEVAKREYSWAWGYFHHARVKLGRKVYVLTRFVTYGNAEYLMENHPAWNEKTQLRPVPEENERPPDIEPSPSTIELDEPSNEEAEWEPANPPTDELERQCRVLFALKADKKETDADFNEQIKACEEVIRGLLRRREDDRLQQRLPLEAVPDDQAEAALDAASEESQETALDGPVSDPGPDTTEPRQDAEPEEPDPVPAAPVALQPFSTESGAPDAPGEPIIEIDPPFPQCEECGGTGGPSPGVICGACGGEGIQPEVRESNQKGTLLCYRCSKQRAFWAFRNFGGGKKGHICNVCRRA